MLEEDLEPNEDEHDASEYERALLKASAECVPYPKSYEGQREGDDADRKRGLHDVN